MECTKLASNLAFALRGATELHLLLWLHLPTLTYRSLCAPPALSTARRFVVRHHTKPKLPRAQRGGIMNFRAFYMRAAARPLATTCANLMTAFIEKMQTT